MVQDISAGKSPTSVLGPAFRKAVLGAALVASTACAAPHKSILSRDASDRCVTGLKVAFRTTAPMEMLGTTLETMPADDLYHTVSKWSDVERRQAVQMAEPENAALFSDWMARFDGVRNASDEVKMKAIIAAIEQNFTFQSDLVTYGRKEQWATSVDFLKRRRGDCEDGARLQYDTARALGIPAAKLRLVLVDDVYGLEAGHAVLAFNGEIRQAYLPNPNATDAGTQPPRTSYTVYYAMNENGVWYAPKNTVGTFGRAERPPQMCVPANDRMEMATLGRR